MLAFQPKYLHNIQNAPCTYRMHRYVNVHSDLFGRWVLHEAAASTYMSKKNLRAPLKIWRLLENVESVGIQSNYSEFTLMPLKVCQLPVYLAQHTYIFINAIYGENANIKHRTFDNFNDHTAAMQCEKCLESQMFEKCMYWFVFRIFSGNEGIWNHVNRCMFIVGCRFACH